MSVCLFLHHLLSTSCDTDDYLSLLGHYDATIIVMHSNGKNTVPLSNPYVHTIITEVHVCIYIHFT